MMDDEMTEQLHDYLDGLLGEAERKTLESRLADDSSLRGELEALRALRADVNALPRHVEPGRDLWPEIESRLDAPGRRTIDFGRRRSRGRIPVARYLVAAAALVLFVLSAPYWFAPRSNDAAPTTATGGMETSLPDDPEFKRVAGQYLAARDELMTLLEERRDEIPPETYAVVEENLSVIASAVTEIETALAARPENANLERMLYAAYRSEVNLLKQAVQLSDVPAASNPAKANGGDDDAG